MPSVVKSDGDATRASSRPAVGLASVATALALLLLLSASASSHPDPVIATVAGGGPDRVPALQSSLPSPSSLALDPFGNVYFASAALQRVFKIEPSGRLTLIAGNGLYVSPKFNGDGGPAVLASLCNPSGLWVDAAQNVYIADTCNGRIRRVDASTGIITTVLGGHAPNGEYLDAFIDHPTAVAFDLAGDMFVVDRNYALDKLASWSYIVPIMGTSQ